MLALIAEGDKADVDEAVKAARKAFEEGKWSSISPHQRTRYLLKMAELIDQHASCTGVLRHPPKIRSPGIGPAGSKSG